MGSNNHNNLMTVNQKILKLNLDFHRFILINISKYFDILIK